MNFLKAFSSSFSPPNIFKPKVVSHSVVFFFNFNFIFKFLIGGELLYDVLVSAIQQCKSAISIHIYPLPLEPPSHPPPSHPSRSAIKHRAELPVLSLMVFFTVLTLNVYPAKERLVSDFTKSVLKSKGMNL